jgi:type III pantothenate kinase
MLLAIDVGNSKISLGVFDGGELITRWRLLTDRTRTADEYGIAARNLFELAALDFKLLEGVAIASVVLSLNPVLLEMAEAYFNLTPLLIEHTTRTGLPLRYETPSSIGADRIVDAVAAVHKYGAPCIVADLGTATTIDAVNAEGEFLGGIIAAGAGIMLDALTQRAPRLPRAEIARPLSVIGSSTIHSIQSGIYFGYIALVDGIIQRMIDEMNCAPRVVATGGIAPLIAGGSKFIEVIDETLTLEGIRLVYEGSRH